MKKMWVILLIVFPLISHGASSIFSTVCTPIHIATATIEFTIDDKKIDGKINIPFFFDSKNKNIVKWLNLLIWDTVDSLVGSNLGSIKGWFEEEEPPYPRFFIKGTYKVFSMKHLMSIVLDVRAYTGGAGGILMRKSITVDFNKQRILRLQDILSHNTIEKIRRKIIEEIKKEPMKYINEAIERVKNHPLEYNFYFKKEDVIVIYFRKYEIAPGYRGILEFKIPLSELENF